MMGILGLINLMLGRVFDLIPLKHYVGAILSVFLLAHFYVIGTYFENKPDLGDEILLLIYLSSSLLSIVFYRKEEYFERFMQYTPIYLVLAFSDLYISSFLLGTFILLLAKNKSTMLVGNTILAVAMLSLLNIWGLSESLLLSFVAMISSLIVILLKDNRSKASETLLITIGFLSLKTGLWSNQFFYGIVISLAVLIFLDLKKRRRILTTVRIFSFLMVGYFELFSIPCLVAFSFLCLDPMVESTKVDWNKTMTEKINSRKIFLGLYGSSVFLYLLKNFGTFYENIFILLSWIALFLSFSLQNLKNGIYKDDLFFGSLFLLFAVVWGIYG